MKYKCLVIIALLSLSICFQSKAQEEGNEPGAKEPTGEEGSMSDAESLAIDPEIASMSISEKVESTLQCCFLPEITVPLSKAFHGYTLQQEQSSNNRLASSMAPQDVYI